eukprot:scpid30067/ scgid1484/ Coiled-coil domain-containing protein KIAA1407
MCDRGRASRSFVDQPASKIYADDKAASVGSFEFRNVIQQQQVEKWIQDVDAAADRALSAHLKEDLEDCSRCSIPTIPPSHGTSHAQCRSHDVITEARQLLSQYMDDHAEPLSEANRLTMPNSGTLLGKQYQATYPYPACQNTVSCPSEALGDAHFMLNTMKDVHFLDLSPELSVGDEYTTTNEQHQVHAEVGDVVNQLMAAPIQQARSSRSHDPNITMDARRMQAQERSRKRRVKEAQRREVDRISSDAKKLIMEQQAHDEAKQKIEDMLLQAEVNKLRKKVKTEKEDMERALKKTHSTEVQDLRLSDWQSKAVPGFNVGQSGLSEDLSTDQIRASTKPSKVRKQPTARITPSLGSSISTGKSKLSSKHQETQQVQARAEEDRRKQDAKDELKLLQRVFTAWHSIVIIRQHQHISTIEIWKWRQLFRYWTRWKSNLRALQLKRDEEEEVRVQLKQKRDEVAAKSLHRKFLLRRCLWAWRRFTKQVQFLATGDQLKTRHTGAAAAAAATDDDFSHRGKMAKLLHVIASGGSETGSAEQVHAHRTTQEQLVMTASAKRPAHLQNIDHHMRTSSSATHRHLIAPLKYNPEQMPPNVITRNVALRHLEQAAVSRHTGKHSLAQQAHGASETVKNVNKHDEDEAAVSHTDHIQGEWERPSTHDHVSKCVTRKKAVSFDGGCASVACHQPQSSQGGADKLTSPLESTTPSSGTSATLSTSTGNPPRTSHASIAQISPKKSTAHKPWKSQPVNKQAHSQTRGEDSGGSKAAKPQLKVDNAQLHHKAVVEAHHTKQSALLSAMEQRSTAIAARKKQREQRKKEAEEQRLADLRQLDEEKRRVQEAEKKVAVEKRRVERARTKEAERMKAEAIRKQLEQNQVAARHYNMSLVKYHGLLPWKKFMTHVQKLENLADQFSEHFLKVSAFQHWLMHCRRREESRQQLADDLNQIHVMRSHFKAWLYEVLAGKELYRLALEHNNKQLRKEHFYAWREYCRQVKRDQWEKERRAILHDNRRMRKSYFQQWQTYVPLHRQEAEQQKRRDLLHMRVSQWLPDYQPNKSRETE